MPTQNQGLIQLPKQKNKQYSTAKIQRTAHHVCLPGNNKKLKCINSFRLAENKTDEFWSSLVVSTQLLHYKSCHLNWQQPYREVNQWWASVGQHWQWHITASWTAPAQVTNRSAAATALSPQIRSPSSSRCLLWKLCQAYHEISVWWDFTVTQNG